MVQNGPDVHPGANFVEDEHGNLIDLSAYMGLWRSILLALQSLASALAGWARVLHCDVGCDSANATAFLF